MRKKFIMPPGVEHKEKPMMPSGVEQEGSTDWERLKTMSDEEAYQNALSDPDNQPLSKSDFQKLKVRRISPRQV